MTTETMSTYEVEARRVASKIGLTVKAEQKGDGCPPWKTPCDCIHGDRYRVTLRKKRRSMSFDFWNSLKDMQDGKEPGYYDVLSCISSDATGPTDPDEVVEEYGDMKPSQAIAAAKFSARLQAFFSGEEIDALGEVC